jgi:hypothetical protein
MLKLKGKILKKTGEMGTFKEKVKFSLKVGKWGHWEKRSKFK